MSMGLDGSIALSSVSDLTRDGPLLTLALLHLLGGDTLTTTSIGEVPGKSPVNALLYLDEIRSIPHGGDDRAGRRFF